MTIIDSISTLLASSLQGGGAGTLTQTGLLRLIGAAQLLLSFGLVGCQPAKAAFYLMKIVRAYPLMQRRSVSPSAHTGLSVMFLAFALCQGDYPISDHPAHDHPYVQRATQAIEFLAHYTSPESNLDATTANTLMSFGLLHMLSHSQTYGLKDRDLSIISAALSRLGPRLKDVKIHALPQESDIRINAMDIIAMRLRAEATTRHSHFISGINAQVQGYLTVLLGIYRESESNILTERTHLFVTEVFCRVRSQKSRICCWRLLDRLPFLSLSYCSDLLKTPAARNIILLLVQEHCRAQECFTRLKGAKGSRLFPLMEECGGQMDEIMDEHTAKERLLFSTGQLWLLITLALRSSDTNSTRATKQALLEHLTSCEVLMNCQSSLEPLSQRLAQQFQTLPNALDRWWTYRVLGCMLEAEGCQRPDPRWERVDKGFQLQRIPESLKGLSSFIN